jgi:Flp pilus assembly protein TadD
MPNDINAHLAIGKILMAQGNLAAAEKQLRQILKVAPENQEARQHLSKIERQKSGAP